MWWRKAETIDREIDELQAMKRAVEEKAPFPIGTIVILKPRNQWDDLPLRTPFKRVGRYLVSSGGTSVQAELMSLGCKDPDDDRWAISLCQSEFKCLTKPTLENLGEYLISPYETVRSQAQDILKILEEEDNND